MAEIKFTDNSVAVKGALEEAVLRFLKEASSDLASQTERNSRNTKYGDYDVRHSWKSQVFPDEMMAQVGSPLEAAYWEELGTGEYALNHDGRKGWWVYVEGNSTLTPSTQPIYTEREAKAIAASMRSEGLDAHATKGVEANRPLFKTFESNKAKIIRRAEQILKGRME